MDRIQIALATDMRFLRPTLVAMMSAIAHASRPADVHVLGDSLTQDARALIETGCRAFPGTKLIQRDVSEHLADAPEAGQWPRSVLGILLLPGLVQGRALFLDSDTITCGDVAPLFDLDMAGNPIAAVRDVSILNDIRKGVAERQEYFESVSKLMEPFALRDNFNTGVVVMDCERIREGGWLRDGMIGRDEVAAFGNDDQNILNAVFKGRATFIGPEWNCFWGEAGRARRIMRETLPDGGGIVGRPRTRIIHFKGDMKPWNIGAAPHARLSTWLRFGPAALSYRVRARSLLRPLERLHGGF